MQRWVRVVLVTGIILSGTAPAFADDADAENKAAFEKGRALYEEGRFQEAHDVFTEIYNRTGEPKLLFNLAASAEGMGDSERAKAYYQVYLEELPDAEDAAEVRERIKRLSEPSAPIEVKPSPTPEPVEKKPAVLDSENVDASTYYKKEEKKKRPWWPVLTMGLGGMVLVGGTITAILAKSKYEGLESSCKPNCTDEQIHPAKASAVASDVQFALGGAAVTAGLVGFFLLRKKYKEHPKAAYVAPTAGSRGGGLVVGGMF